MKVDLEPEGLRERKKRATYDSLIDSAQRLVAERGLDAVTVEEVCAEAGVSTRTFFNYFDSKDDAVLGIQPWELDQELVEIFRAGGPTGVLGTDLQALVAGMTSLPVPGRARVAAGFALARAEPRLFERQIAWFEQHRLTMIGLVSHRLGTPTDAPRAEMIAMLVLTLSRATIHYWQAAGAQGDALESLPDVFADAREIFSGP